MATVKLTERAKQLVRDSKIAFQHERSLLIVGYEQPTLDNSRGPEGENVWRTVRSGDWYVYLSDSDQFEGPELELTDCVGLDVRLKMDRHALALRGTLLVDASDGKLVAGGYEP